jgi:hypothetical protein
MYIGAIIITIDLYIDYCRGVELPEEVKEDVRRQPLLLLCAIVLAMATWPHTIYKWCKILINYLRRK